MGEVGGGGRGHVELSLWLPLVRLLARFLLASFSACLALGPLSNNSNDNYNFNKVSDAQPLAEPSTAGRTATQRL